MTSSRVLVSFLLLAFFLIQPAYGLPLTVVDPTKRQFTHDPNGNLTEELAVSTGAKTLYAYDTLNRLAAVSSLRARQSSLADEAISSYTYDGEGKRIAATESGVTTTSLYDGLLPDIERQGSVASTVNVWGLSYGGGIGGLLCRYNPQSPIPNPQSTIPLPTLRRLR